MFHLVKKVLKKNIFFLNQLFWYNGSIKFQNKVKCNCFLVNKFYLSKGHSELAPCRMGKKHINSFMTEAVII